jgi:2-polyprenyl-3-methyl-5-hydroxy-6-metoxy-1,4-benzoquinol methylase
VTGQDGATEHPCDLCGSEDAVEVPHAREFTGDQPIHICTRCGFVYVKRRRPAEAIAASWTEEIFGSGYTARIPAVIARLTYVAELLEQTLGLEGKRVCEIGAGEGEFLRIVRGHGAEVFGIEPSGANCERMRRGGVECFEGTIEQYRESGEGRDSFDIVAILWTLENCRSCREMLSAAHELLREGGRVAVATGSRLLVPFKKPLHAYLSPTPADTHAFRFSANTLQALLAVSGFDVVEVNRYVDNDILCVVGSKGSAGEAREWRGDDYLEVHSFFERWYADTKVYWPDPVG